MSRHRRLITLVVVTTIFAVGHHVDHIIRGNHVGWPLIPDITAFTYSLLFYPFIVLGFYLFLRGRAAPGYWAILTGVGFAFVGLTHFGPLAVEPPGEILGPYDSALAGYVALGWLVAFLVALGVTSVYAVRLLPSSGDDGGETAA